jgi:uncharacterized RDD family membrane protein YckC
VNASLLAYVCLGVNIAAYGYYIALHAKFGQTVGKMATGVKVVDKSEQSAISWRQAVMRYIVQMLLSVPLVAWIFKFGFPVKGGTYYGIAAIVAYAWGIAISAWFVAEVVTMLCNRKRRAVHDFIAGTVVVRVVRDTAE